MPSGSAFRYERHLEIWKDQNKLIKRVVLATLILAFFILIRVLIPLNDETLLVQKKIKENQDAIR